MPLEYDDPRFARRVVSIVPGEFYVTNCDVIISTVLGSCVAACIRDRRHARGGMNHFMLAGEYGEPQVPLAAREPPERCGTAAMDRLVASLLECGTRCEDLEAKIFGGAGTDLLEPRDVGRDNVLFVKSYLEAARICVAAQDLGGRRSRKIYFFVRTGEIKLRYFGAAGETQGYERKP